MSCGWWETGGGVSGGACPVHGVYGGRRCSQCCAGTEPEVAVTHAPLVAPAIAAELLERARNAGAEARR